MTGKTLDPERGDSLILAKYCLGAPELLPQPRPVIVLASLLLLLLAVLTWKSRPGNAADLPWAGTDSIRFPRFRAFWRGVRNAAQVADEGYHRCSKHGKPYLFLGVMSGTTIMLPDHNIEEIISLPSHILNVNAVLVDNLQADYTLPHPNLISSQYHVPIIKRGLVNRLSLRISEMVEEMSSALDQCLGRAPDEWKEVKAFDTILRAVCGTASRMFVGLPLCRNEDYLSTVEKYALGVFTSASIIRFFPIWLKPLVAYTAGFRNRPRYRKYASFVIPLIEKRLADRCDVRNEESDDLLDLLINNALSLDKHFERTPEMLAYRLMVLNLAGTYTVALAGTHLLFNLLGSAPERGYVEGIREEATRVITENGGIVTESTLTGMVRLDSAIRESLRVAGFGITGLARKVVHRNGYTLKDGLHLPFGAVVGVPQWSMHHDDDLYPDATDYDAFRFSRELERRDEGSTDEASKKEPLPAVHTSKSYLGFGHGKHSCPARLFAVDELKLLFSHLFVKYDIKVSGGRPQNVWFADKLLPPMQASIYVRRRKDI